MRSIRVFVLLVVLAACSSDGPSSAAPGCQLTEVPGSSIVKDALSGVASVGPGALAVGTRFSSGASGGAVSYLLASSTSRAELMHAFGGRVTEMDDVAAEPGGGAWAVGAFGSSAPAVAHLVGNDWVEAVVADPGPGEDGLGGVVAVSADLAWAVGRRSVGTVFRPLIERWDGASWRQTDAAHPVGSAMLKDVSATGPDDAWAVGWQVVGRSYRPLVERWDGTSWTLVPTPGLGSGDAVLSGVLATATDEAWAAGWVTSGTGTLRPVVERWDGRAWSVVPLDDDIGPAGLTSLAPVPGGVVAVGRTTAGNRPQPLALRYDGTSWTTLPVTLAQPEQGGLTGVSTDGSGTIWAIGVQQTSEGLGASLVVSGCGST